MAFGVGDDLSVRVTSQTADFQAGMQAAQSGLNGLRNDAIQTAAAMQVLQGRVDEAGDESMQAGAQASASSGGFLSAASGAATAEISFGSLSAVTAATLIPSLLTLTTVLAPLAAALGGFITVAGAIGGVGLVGFIGAAMTETERLQRSFDQLVSTVQSEFAPVFEIFGVVLNSLIRDLTDIIPQLVPAEDVVESIAVSFMTLGEAVIASLPAFVDLAVTLTQRFLPAFTRWAQGVLPQIPGMLAGLIPVMLQVGQALGPLVDAFMEIAPTMTEFGLTTLNVVVPAIESFLGVWDGAMEAVNGMQESTSEIVSAFAILAPVVAGLGNVFGGALLSGVTSVGSAILGLTNPVTGLIVAIGALGWVLKNHRKTISRFANQAIDLLQSVVRDAATWIMENGPRLIKDAFKAIGSGIRFIVKDIYNAITGNDDSILRTIITDFGSWLINKGPGILKEGAKLAFNAIKAAAQGLVTGLMGEEGALKQLFNDLASFMMNDVPGMLADGAITAVSTLFAIYQSGFNRIANFISGIWNTISETLISAFSGVVETIVSGINGLIGVVQDAADKVGKDLGLGQIDAPSLDEQGLNLSTDRTTNVGDLQEQNEQTIRVVLDEQTDVVQGRIQEGAEMVVEDRERRTQRNSGRNPNPR